MTHEISTMTATACLLIKLVSFWKVLKWICVVPKGMWRFFVCWVNACNLQVKTDIWLSHQTSCLMLHKCVTAKVMFTDVWCSGHTLNLVLQRKGKKNESHKFSTATEGEIIVIYGLVNFAIVPKQFLNRSFSFRPPFFFIGTMSEPYNTKQGRQKHKKHKFSCWICFFV